MRTRRQKKKLPRLLFTFQIGKSSGYVIAQGVLSVTAVSIPQQYLTDQKCIKESE